MLPDTITLTFRQFKSILVDIDGNDVNGIVNGFVNYFNMGEQTSKYGHARLLEKRMFGEPPPGGEFGIYRIKFHGPEMKTLFLLKFGQYLK